MHGYKCKRQRNQRTGDVDGGERAVDYIPTGQRDRKRRKFGIFQYHRPRFAADDISMVVQFRSDCWSDQFNTCAQQCAIGQCRELFVHRFKFSRQRSFDRRDFDSDYASIDRVAAVEHNRERWKFRII